MNEQQIIEVILAERYTEPPDPVIMDVLRSMVGEIVHRSLELAEVEQLKDRISDLEKRPVGKVYR